jgi:uncharacterized protein YcbX
MTDPLPTVARLAVYPIKALDPLVIEEATVVPTGSLEYDREFAIVDVDGEYVHGKRTPEAHRVRADYDFGPDRRRVRLRERGRSMGQWFDLLADRDDAEGWLSDFFDLTTELVRRADGGYPDLTEYPSGPTVISTGTLREVASWYPGMTTEEARLRFRANIEVEGVPPFWEDRLYTGTDEEIRFDVGDVTVAGVQPTPRCAVPLRNPHTGEETEGFRSTFLSRREETYPEWGDEDAFQHYFHLTVNTHVPDSEVGKTLAVGDEVRLHDDNPVPRRVEQES